MVTAILLSLFSCFFRRSLSFFFSISFSRWPHKRVPGHDSYGSTGMSKQAVLVCDGSADRVTRGGSLPRKTRMVGVKENRTDVLGGDISKKYLDTMSITSPLSRSHRIHTYSGGSGVTAARFCAGATVRRVEICCETGLSRSTTPSK